MAFAPRRFLSVGITIIGVVGLIGATLLKIKETEAQKAADSAKAKTPAPGAAPKGDIAQTSATDQFSTADPLPVEGMPVRKDTLRLYVVANATAQADRQLTLTAEAGGRVARVPVQENQRIAAGAVVLQLDTTDFVMDLTRARNALQQSMQTYREQTLDLDEITDPTIRAQRDSAIRIKFGLPSAQLNLTAAQMAYDRSTLKAPFDGRIANVEVIPGQRIGAGTEIATLIDLDPMRIEAEALEADIGLIAPGATARVTFAALGDQEFVGRVATINPIVGAARTARVTIILPNPNGKILPGMTAKARLEAQKFPDRIIIPLDAVLTTADGRDRVFVALKKGDKTVADWRYVTLGRRNDREVELLPNDQSPMPKDGDIVITKGHYTLAHDTPITLVQNAALAGARPD